MLSQIVVIVNNFLLLFQVVVVLLTPVILSQYYCIVNIKLLFFYDILLCYPIYNKNITSGKIFLTIIHTTKHKLYFTNIFQIWTNRTSVPVLYCTTIMERAFGRGYLKLKISFYFFKNAKADSPTHSLLNFSTHLSPTPHHQKLQPLNPSIRLPFTQITIS